MTTTRSWKVIRPSMAHTDQVGVELEYDPYVVDEDRGIHAEVRLVFSDNKRNWYPTDELEEQK